MIGKSKMIKFCNFIACNLNSGTSNVPITIFRDEIYFMIHHLDRALSDLGARCIGDCQVQEAHYGPEIALAEIFDEDQWF